MRLAKAMLPFTSINTFRGYRLCLQNYIYYHSKRVDAQLLMEACSQTAAPEMKNHLS